MDARPLSADPGPSDCSASEQRRAQRRGGLDPCAPRRAPLFREDALRAMVEGSVIPALLARCRAVGPPRPAPGPAEADALARAALAHDAAAASAQVAALYAGGVEIESLLNDLIAPAAIRLGDYWRADTADFVEVALASQRLLAIVRALGEQLERAHPAPVGAPLAIIGSPAIERHAMGALIVAHSFRAAGWRVREAPGADGDELEAAVALENVALVGLSICSERAFAALPAAISRLRRASRNQALLVAIGGAAVLADPAGAERLGADFLARDAREAVSRARQTLSKSA